MASNRKPARKSVAAKKVARAVPKQQPSFDVAGATGITALAAQTGTSPDNVLALVSLLLCGTAGTEAWLGDLLTGLPLAKLDLLVPADDQGLQRVIDQLVSRVRMVNRTLAGNMGRFSPDIVSVMLHGAFAGVRPAKNAGPAETAEALNRHRQALSGTAGGTESLMRDLQADAKAHNVEGTLHPEFLIEHTKCRDLEDTLECCHQRSAIVVRPKLESLRGGSEPVKDLRRLMDLMEGRASPVRTSSPGRAASLPLRAHTVLVANPADLALMSGSAPELLSRFLWLSGVRSDDSAGLDERQAADEIDAAIPGSGDIGSLMQAFNQALQTILGTRRSGQTPVAGFESRETCAEFQSRINAYGVWIGTLAVDPADDPGQVARELPAMLYWALGFLCRELPDAQRPAENDRLEVAFGAARRLVANHTRDLNGFRNADRVRQRFDLARRIVEVVDEKAPLRMRALVRSFSLQHVDRFQPVIGILIKLGVLERDEEGRFVPGEVDLSEVEEELAGVFSSRTMPIQKDEPEPGKDAPGEKEPRQRPRPGSGKES